ncbi:hypothetical protein llap_3726 [Limosa lapponica baueri]|uniref:Uncharacterized protein n=1 Tax=Limosa lapponica baueri TaxID=1758121 RepID=A0A2I0UIX2_LIMLA|nr:hypothetical protein llap_3726 [Limosa lapponica baueri]
MTMHLLYRKVMVPGYSDSYTEIPQSHASVNVLNSKQYWSQHGPLRDTTCHCSPSGLQAIEYYPLDATIQPIPYPLNSPPIKSISLQFGEQDIVGDRVKSLTKVQIDHIHRSSLIY